MEAKRNQEVVLHLLWDESQDVQNCETDRLASVLIQPVR